MRTMLFGANYATSLTAQVADEAALLEESIKTTSTSTMRAYFWPLCGRRLSLMQAVSAGWDRLRAGLIKACPQISVAEGAYTPVKPPLAEVRDLSI